MTAPICRRTLPRAMVVGLIGLMISGGTAGTAAAEGVEAGRCKAIADPRGRLACYDAAFGAPTAPPEVAGGLPAGMAPEEGAGGIRVGVGAGLALGNYDGSFDVTLGGDDATLRSDNGVGGSSITPMASLWYDMARPRSLAIGLEYNRSDYRAGLTLDAPAGLDVVSDPVAGDLKARLVLNTVFVNVAWFPDRDATLAPFVGLGIGGGRGSLDVGSSVSSDVLASDLSLADADERFWYPAAQAFFGIQYELTSHVVAEMVAKYMVMTGLPADVDHTYRHMLVGTNLMYRF